MQANPVQKRAQNAFLLGMLIMLVVAVIAGGLIYFFLLKPTEDEKKTEKEQEKTEEVQEKVVYAYKLKNDVESGDEIKTTMVETIKIAEANVPTDYVRPQETQKLENYKSKINLKKGTILSQSMLYTGTQITDSLRLVEFNMFTPMTTLAVGEYIDVRLTMPTGQDYIVLAKKCIQSINNGTIGLYLTEEEIITANCAIVESYITNDASNLYITKYIEPGVQQDAIPNYPVNISVLTLIESNPNIVQSIKDTIKARYSTEQRNYIDGQLSQYADRQLDNISSRLEEQKEKSRKQYLEGLAGQ